MSTIVCKRTVHARLARHYSTLCLLLALALLAGCGSKKAEMPQFAMPAQDPLMVGGDGIPLSPTEMRVFQSTGQLDRNLPAAARQDVSIQYKHFLRKARTTMERFSQRSENYLAHARKVFRDKGMPEELAFLAIVESGYNAKAVSPVGAAGAWQFMPYTGMKYGLNQDWWMDERLDPYKSAEAAADYLSKLYGDFKDWHLAIAAYNAGEGKISRALEGTGAKTFFELVAKNHKLDDKAQLRAETKNYVPRFLAISKIMRNLTDLGFAPVDMNRRADVARVEVRPGTDLLALAQAANMNWNEFNALNLSHKRHVTHIDRRSHVYVPTRSQSAVATAAGSGRDGKGWQTYVAGRNDNWQNLSRRTGVPVAALQASNRSLPALRAGSKVRLPGWAELRIPAPEKATVAEAGTKGKGKGKGKGREAAPVKSTASAGSTSYKLQPGDNLTGIAREHDTTVSALMALNDIDDASKIRSGQTLLVPSKAEERAPARAVAQAPSQNKGAPVPVAAKAPVRSVAAVKTATQSKAAVAVPAASAERGPSGSLGKGSAPSASKASAKSVTYTVQPGDTLWGIARKHNLSTDQLLALNKSDGKGPLKAGAKLLVSQQ